MTVPPIGKRGTAPAGSLRVGEPTVTFAATAATVAAVVAMVVAGVAGAGAYVLAGCAVAE